MKQPGVRVRNRSLHLTVMTSLSFEIAPPNRSILWDQALTIAFTPAVTLFACVAYFTGEMLMATVSAVVAFIGTLLFAMPLARPRLGRIQIEGETLDLSSGFLRVRLPLSQFDLQGTRLAAADDAPADGLGLQFTTSSLHRVIIPRRDGTCVQLSPTHPETFIQTLRALDRA